jgi:hypothetical protein
METVVEADELDQRVLESRVKASSSSSKVTQSISRLSVNVPWRLASQIEKAILSDSDVINS